MLWSAEATLLVVGALCLASSDAIAAEALQLEALEGSYTSEIEGGCELQLRADGSFVMSCGALPPCSGRVVGQGAELGVMCGGRPPSPHWPSPLSLSRPRRGVPAGGVVGGFPSEVGDPSPWIRAVPLAVPAPERSTRIAWPPPVGDPTRGPYVSGWRGPGESFWLEPVRWGERLYLIRSGEHAAFCRAVASGVEPRTTAAGHHFLRRGDHRKRCPTRNPDFCVRSRGPSGVGGAEGLR